MWLGMASTHVLSPAQAALRRERGARVCQERGLGHGGCGGDCAAGGPAVQPLPGRHAGTAVPSALRFLLAASTCLLLPSFSVCCRRSAGALPSPPVEGGPAMSRAHRATCASLPWLADIPLWQGQRRAPPHRGHHPGRRPHGGGPARPHPQVSGGRHKGGMIC